MTKRLIVDAKLLATEGTFGDAVEMHNSEFFNDATFSAMRVRKAVIPYIPYNVNVHNNSFVLMEDPNTYVDEEMVPPYLSMISHTLEIPIGRYDIYELIDALTRVINEAFTPIVFRIDIDDLTNKTKITISNTAHRFSFRSTAGVSTLIDMLGFIGIQQFHAGENVSHGPFNINPDRMLFITCDQCAGFRNAIAIMPSTQEWLKGIVAVIPIPHTAQYGDVIVYTPENDAPWVRVNQKVTESLSYTFRLARNSAPVMGPGQVAWMMDIEIIQ